MLINKNLDIDLVEDNYIVMDNSNKKLKDKALVLNETATYILKAIMETKTEKEILENIVKEYNIDYETAKNDLDSYLKLLKDKGIIYDK